MAETKQAMRSVLTLNVSLGLFGFPVSVYKGTNDPGEGIAFRQIHNKCQKPINVVKRCNHCAEDVTMADLLKGYPSGPDSFVTFTEAEIKALKPEQAGSIKIAGYLGKDDIDAVYQTGAVYYLKPDGKDGTTFATWREALAGRWAVGTVVLYGREQVIAIRALENVLVMHTIRTHAEVRNPQHVPGYDKVPTEVKREYLDMMNQLLDAQAISFDDVVLESDAFQTAVRAMIDARLAGQELPAQAEVTKAEAPSDIMAMLKASVEAAKAKKVAA